MNEENLKITVRLVSVFILVFLGIYLFFKNYPLYGEVIELHEKDISDLTPESRVSKVLVSDSEVKKQIEDLVYFTTNSEGFDSAVVRITFLNQTDHEIHTGFKDKANEWHYFTKPVYLPLIEKLNWYKTNHKPPVFYQRKKKYATLDQFLNDIPEKAAVGSYYLTEDYAREQLEGYTKKSNPTKTEIPLRGPHTFYTYLQDEPFFLKVEKQDLNWYEGADKLKIRVSNNGEILTEETIDDDGVSDTSRKAASKSQIKEISYEGGNPENGLYKIELLTNNDVIIKSIESSFGLISFQGPLYPVGNSAIYTLDLLNGKENVIYTNSSNLTLRTPHTDSRQIIKVNGKDYEISEVNKDYFYKTDSIRNTVTIPRGDVIINGVGYLALSTDQFFTPFLFNKKEVKNNDDLKLIDYLLTDYVKPFNSDSGWKEAELKFDLKSAVHVKGKLGWIIKVPGLKGTGNFVLIKNIEVILEKEPIIK